MCEFDRHTPQTNMDGVSKQSSQLLTFKVKHLTTHCCGYLLFIAIFAMYF